MIEIKVDVRETYLLEQIKNLVENIPSYKDLVIKSESLPLGDILICSNDITKLVIERKSISDLNSSIKDGRYEEQSFRLTGMNHHNHNILYVIEGDINKVNRFRDNRIEKMTLYSAIFSLNYYKGFSVIRTFCIDETALFVCNSAYKMKKGEQEGRKPFFTNDVQMGGQDIQNTSNEIETNLVENSDYVSVVKNVKKENVTPENIGAIMLCQIPGISSVTANSIMNEFNTIPNLLTALEKDENCLKDITYTTTKNQVRKINKSIGINIIKYLLKK